jgi:hypothetical protein
MLADAGRRKLYYHLVWFIELLLPLCFWRQFLLAWPRQMYQHVAAVNMLVTGHAGLVHCIMGRGLYPVVPVRLLRLARLPAVKFLPTARVNIVSKILVLRPEIRIIVRFLTSVQTTVSVLAAPDIVVMGPVRK